MRDEATEKGVDTGNILKQKLVGESLFSFSSWVFLPEIQGSRYNLLNWFCVAFETKQGFSHLKTSRALLFFNSVLYLTIVCSFTNACSYMKNFEFKKVMEVNSCIKDVTCLIYMKPCMKDFHPV